jgi:hypothetical protein
VIRTAILGDYFLIASPIGEAAERLNAIQEAIAEAIRGVAADQVHLTLQRFEIPESAGEASTLDAIEQAISGERPPVVIAATLFSTYHRYFARNSVRWRIEPTPDLGRLTLQTAQAIMHQGGTSHWPNADAPIDQFITAAWTDDEIEVPESLLHYYPQRIMDVSHLEVTRLVAKHQFEIIRVFDIGHTTA